MNAVSLVGRLGKDIALRTSNGGPNGPTQYAHFTLAVSEVAGGKEITNWIPCVVWGRQAENMAKFLQKGSLIALTGKITVRNTQENGQYQSIVQVRADHVEFLGSKSNGNNNGGGNNGGNQYSQSRYNNNKNNFNNSFDPNNPLGTNASEPVEQPGFGEPFSEPITPIATPVETSNNETSNSEMAQLDDSILWD